MYILLQEGDAFKVGDEMLSPMTGEWSPVPDQWVKNGFKFSHNDDNTFSRHKIQVRRKIDDGHIYKLLEESLATLNHAAVFISSREKMHKDGQKLYNELIDKISDTI
jgi:hypothetical protein